MNSGILCKATTTDTLVHGSSFCPNSHKMTAFNVKAYRLATISVSDHEFRKLARSNEVYISINRLVGKKIIKQMLDLTTSLPRECHICGFDNKFPSGVPRGGPLSLYGSARAMGVESLVQS